MHKKFTTALLKWHKSNARSFPWKEDKNPYKIWVSEIILQQTRVAQGLPYYNKFIATFPNIQALARAKEEKLMKVWQGLGYYSRARNMHATAKLISKEMNGVFPSTYEELLALKGIGPYTAAAIGSFAFGLSHPVVDGNVLRVISRVWSIEESIDDSTTKKVVLEHCSDAIILTDPAHFNQAIMDFGATQCTPGLPDCAACQLNKICKAYGQNRVKELPRRTKKIKQKKRTFRYAEIICNNKVLIRKRTEKDIWLGLFEFPYLEGDSNSSVEDIVQKLLSGVRFPKGIKTVGNPTKSYKQKLSHQTILGHFDSFTTEHIEIIDKERYQLVERTLVHTFAVPKIIDWYLNDNSITLF